MILVHQSLLETIRPDVAQALLTVNVKLLCDEPTLSALTSSPPKKTDNHPPNFRTHVLPAPPEAYTTEHLSLTLSVRTVPSLAAAIAHINEHGSHHTDCIITELTSAGSTFVRGVDSAGVFVDASTRFADSFRYGFGTEVGISAGRIHARRPVGLEESGNKQHAPTHRGEEAPFLKKKQENNKTRISESVCQMSSRWWVMAQDSPPDGPSYPATSAPPRLPLCVSQPDRAQQQALSFSS
jgi:gamma-glutamyl phosphate reductase